MQFLWGQGKDKVVFPAILGLLNEYSNVWFDTITQGEGADTSISEIVQVVDKASVPPIKTVSWITREQIRDLMQIGRAGGGGGEVGEGRDGKKWPPREEGSGKLTHVASVSVAKALEYGFVNVNDLL